MHNTKSTLKWTREDTTDFLFKKAKEINIVNYHVNRFKDSPKYSVVYDAEKVTSFLHECISITLNKFDLFQRRNNGEAISEEDLSLSIDFTKPSTLAGYLAGMVVKEISKDYSKHSAEIRTGHEFSLDKTFNHDESSQKNSLMNCIASEETKKYEDSVRAEMVMAKIVTVVKEKDKEDNQDLFKYLEFILNPEYLGKYKTLKEEGLVTESYHLFKQKLKKLSQLIQSEFTADEMSCIQEDIQNKYPKVIPDKKEFPKVECEIVKSLNQNLKDKTISAEIYLNVSYNNQKFKIDSVISTMKMKNSQKTIADLQEKLEKKVAKALPSLEKKSEILSEIRITQFKKELKKIKKGREEKVLSSQTVKETVMNLCSQ